MKARRAIVRGLAVILLVGGTSCANLGDLVCQGQSCPDASNESTNDGGMPGIACGAGSTCDPGSLECCLAPGGRTSCVGRSTCNGGTDIFCDDPRQCLGGPCWICINAQGFQGASCNYESDIVAAYQCDMTTALPLCRLASQCAGGKTCKPLFVAGLDTAGTATWFSACQ